MPSHPEVSGNVRQMKGSVFSALAHKLASHPGEVYPLHVGDTWMEPAVGCRMQDFAVEAYPGMHKYASPRGLPSLLDAIAARVGAATDLPIVRDNVLVGAGATGGLAAVCGAILEQGDEVLIVAPHWPLIAGIVRSAKGMPMAVPVVGTVVDAAGAVAALEAAKTARTVAVYFNTPNNPTGRLIPRDWLEAIVAWARANDLWIIADEIYELYVYEGEHTAALSLAPERTFAAYSCSKAYGMAGNRLGWIVGPSRVMDQVRKVSTHTFYSAPTASQLAAVQALDGRGDAWARSAAEKYRELGYYAADRLGVERPSGSTFLWLDVSPHFGPGEGLLGFLGRCVDRGLALAPGPSFGPYPNHVRLCFTSAEPDVVRRGVDVLAGLLGR